jgi:hypothetical protein
MNTLQHALAEFLRGQKPHTVAQQEQGQGVREHQHQQPQTIVQRIANEMKERAKRGS